MSHPPSPERRRSSSPSTPRSRSPTDRPRSPLHLSSRVRTFVTSPVRRLTPPSSPAPAPGPDSPASSPGPAPAARDAPPPPRPGRRRLSLFKKCQDRDAAGAAPGDLFMCGYLEKVAAGVVVGALPKRWYQRWFYLDLPGARLCYVAQEPLDTDAELPELCQALKPRGFIKLDRPRVRLDTGTGQALTFRLHFDLDLCQLNAAYGAQALTLRAPDQASYDQWTVALAKAIDLCRGFCDLDSPWAAPEDAPRSAPPPAANVSRAPRARTRLLDDKTKVLLLLNGVGGVACAAAPSWEALGAVLVAVLLCNAIVAGAFALAPPPPPAPTALTVRREAMAADVSDDEDRGEGAPPAPGALGSARVKMHTAGGLRQGTGAEPNTWQPCDPATFSLRVGPNYAVHKKKAPAPGQLLPMVAMDVFRTAGRVNNIAHALRPPAVPYEVAHWFVINLQIPDYAPPNPLWGPKAKDGPGWSVVGHCPITPEMWAQCEAATGGARALLWRYLHADREANPTDIYSRGKIIGELLNLDDPKLGLPPSPLKVMRSFNARPVLTRPQHLVVHADGHTELAIVVHDFPYVALSGLHSSLDVIPDFVFKMGLVLEGRSDDELPEMLLTCVTVNGLDLRKAVPW